MERDDPRAQRSDAGVLAALASGSVTSREIARHTGLNRATVRVVLQRLLADGAVEMLEPRHLGGRGRPERTYRPRIAELVSETPVA